MLAVRLIPALVLILTFSAGCAPPTGWVEQELERRLPELVGPADLYDVQIEGLRARSGEATRIVAVGERVQPEDAPVVDHFELDLHGVVFDRSEKRIERVDSARASARITALDLEAFLEDQRNVRDARVTLRESDEATIRVRPELGGIALPRGVEVKLTGRLEAENGRIQFVVSDVEAAGLDLGSAAARRLSDLINPLVDFADSEIRLQITSVRTVEDAVLLDATGDLSGLRLKR